MLAGRDPSQRRAISPEFDERRLLKLQDRIEAIERRLDSILETELESSRCTFPLACRLLLKSGRLSPSQLLPGHETCSHLRLLRSS